MRRSAGPFKEGMIRIKRVDESPEPADGVRVLVDRLGPGGLSKEKAWVDEWRKDLAPDDALRRWFGHDPRRWQEFKRRYREELKAKVEGLEGLAKQARRGTITLLHGARDGKHNNAVVLKELLTKLS